MACITAQSVEQQTLDRQNKMTKSGMASALPPSALVSLLMFHIRQILAGCIGTHWLGTGEAVHVM